MKLITNFNSTSSRNLVVVSHSLDEAITKCILNHKNDLEVNIRIVSLHELMSEYDIFDEVNDAGTTIKWIKGSEYISNANYLLLNRVLYVPSALFGHFATIDQEYAKREFEAYLGFSFNAFTGIGNQLANGLCVDSTSLPQQWKKIAKDFEINVPNYYWGPGIFNHLDNQGLLVYSNIYNFLNWSINSKQPNENHVFCFEKPQGEPVFILSIGNEQLISSNIGLSIELKEKISILAGKVNKLFNHFISEILIFVHGSDLVFGCINPEVIRSIGHDDFENFVLRNLFREFYKCMS